MKACQEHRWKSRISASNDIKLLSYTQNRTCMLDRKNKGGKSLVLRCASYVKHSGSCPFYCKLRRSNRDSLWYICVGFQSTHTCEPEFPPPKFETISSLLSARLLEETLDDVDAEGYSSGYSSGLESGSRSPKRNYQGFFVKPGEKDS